MNDIRNELLGTNSGSGENAEGTSKDTEGTERNETESSDFSNGIAIIVYWSEGGSVWHASKDCHHIKNKEVISGTVAQAEKAGYKTGCKTCNKNDP